MKVLVTGGGGFLGNAIVLRLLHAGHEVISFARGDYPELRAMRVQTFQGDLADPAAVTEAAAGCDAIIHTAAKAGVWGPTDPYYRANALGTAHVVRACLDHGIRRLVYTSTPSITFTGADQEGVDESAPVATHFVCAYPATKAMAEAAVLSANGPNLATVALRPHLIWGPEDPHLVPRVIAQARAGKLRIVGSGRKLVDSTYIDNAAHAHICALDRLEPGAPCAGKAYFISNGEPLPMAELLNRILAAGGLPPVKRKVPARLAYAAGVVMEAYHHMFKEDQEPRMTRFVARQLATAHWFNLDAARRDLGYEAIVTIDDGMRELAAWLQERRP
jgi:2-alkyl-3-oxoalkanoate reductase